MKYIKDNLKYIIGITIIIFVVFSIINIYYNTVQYSVSTADDFAHYNTFSSIYKDRNFELFDFAKKYALWDMTHFGGRYFTMFIQILFGPNPYVDIVSKTSMVMVANMFLYFSSLYFFIFSVISKFIIKKSNVIKKIFLSLLLFLSILILHNTYQFYYEIFTWYSAAASYSIPFSFLFLSLGLFVMLIGSEKKVKYLLVVPIVLTSIAALGGSVSVICVAFIMIFSLFIYIIVSKKINAVTLALFLNYFTFALINVMAPGNYSRLELNINAEITSAKNVFDLERMVIVINKINEVIFDRWIYMFNKFAFLFIILIVACIVGYMISKEIHDFDYIKTFFSILPVFFMPTIVTLSFAMGYQDKIELFDRCYFMIDFSIIFSLLLILLFGFTLIFSLVKDENHTKLFQLLIIVIFVVNAFIGNSDKENGLEYKDVNQIQLITVAVDGSQNEYKDYYDKYKETINILRENKGKDSATIKHIDNDIGPTYLMKFHDGKHAPFIANGDFKYLEFFYEIKNIIIQE